ncbi:MAG: GspE/PulE family protein [Candidatus Pacebacteria bacterium]|nr:GspE/PulE family protein [Candidatus Paceibacterota bacterium]
MRIDSKQLGEFIKDSGLISKTDLEKALAKAEKEDVSLGEILLNEGKLTEDEMRRIQAHIIGIPFVDLSDQKIDFDVLSIIPEPIARKHNIIAFKKSDKDLEVAMLDVDDLEAINFIKKKVNLKISPRLTGTASIKSALLQYQKSLKAEFGDLIQKQSQSLKQISEVETENISKEDLKKIAEDLPVIRIVDTLLKHAIIQDASDIHIEPMEDKLLIRYRIDGILHDAMILPKNATASITARIKVLSNLKLDEKRLPQDGRFKVEVDEQKVSFRVSVLPVYYGEKTVMRLLKEGASGFTLESLGFHGEGLERIYNAMKRKTGMLLTTGPTGSGKTTTLYTLLDNLNVPGVNISTIEDPIEYQMPRVNQTQVKPDIGFTFSNGLRALVRQDPDIIMVGEIRDGETASLAVNASLTGHLVLSTLHTNSAAGAIPRLVDMKIDPFLLVSTIDVIIAQRLVRRLSPESTKYYLSKSEISSLSKVVDLDRVLYFLKKEKIVGAKDDWAKIPFYKNNKNADSDGYSGRIGIHEILNMSTPLKDLIMKNATSDQIEEQAKNEGMMTMIEDGIFKAVQGVTTIEEVLRVVSE